MEVGIMVLKIEDTSWVLKLSYGEYEKIVQKLQGLQAAAELLELSDPEDPKLPLLVAKLEELAARGELEGFDVSHAATLIEQSHEVAKQDVNQQVLSIQRQLLRDHVLRVEGLTEGDQPVPWDPAMVDTFSPLQLKEIMGTVMSLGEAQSPTTDAAAT